MRRLRAPVRRGLSLLEVVVGAAVLALFVVPLVSSLISAHRGTVALQEDIGAVLLGLELLDQVRLAPLELIEGMAASQVPDGAQPLLAHFRAGPRHATVKGDPLELARVEALLTLRLSPLPPGYERTIELSPREGLFARAAVRVRFKPDEPGASGRERTRTVTALLVGGGS